MKTLIVSTTDKRPFFDQVVDHGVSHNLLSLARRQELARQCNELHSPFCQKLGLNEWDIDETLKAARLVKQFLSIALEKASGGEITLALQVLNTQRTDKLVFGVSAEIEKALNRVMAIAQTTIYGTTKFGYGVLLSKVRPQDGEHSGLLKFDLLHITANDSFYPFDLLKTCQALKNYALLKAWLADVADLTSEFEVSRRFLPWERLIEQAGFKPAARDADNPEIEVNWTSETFIATLVVTLLCGGSSYLVSTTEGTKYMGTTFPSNFLDFLIRSLQNSDRFRQEGRQSFFSYLDGPEKWPVGVETAYLLKVLGFESREKIPEKSFKTFLSYLEGGEGEPDKEEKKNLLEKFKAVDGNLQAEFSEDIRQSACKKFFSFLNGQAKRPDKEERQCLNRMFEEAMDNLLEKRLDGTLPPKRELLAWAERIHLEVDGQDLWQNISSRKEFKPVGPQKSTAEKVLDAIEEGKSRSSLSKLLSKLDWQKALNENFADALIQKLEPDWILAKMPLMPELVSRLCIHWETRIGRENWKAEHRVALVEKVLKEATADFWGEGYQFFSALAQAHPAKRKELLEKCQASLLARGKEY